MMFIHEDPVIQETIARLVDLMREREKHTGYRSCLIIMDETESPTGYELTALEGKPNDCSPEECLGLWREL